MIRIKNPEMLSFRVRPVNLKFIYIISGIVWKISLIVYTVLQLQQFHKVNIIGFAMNVMDGQVKRWNIYYPDSDSTNTLTYFWEHLTTRCHDIWAYFPSLSSLKKSQVQAYLQTLISHRNRLMNSLSDLKY